MKLNSNNLTKQSLVYSMFNQYVFSEVKNNIGLIERYYLTDPNTMTNTLIKDLLNAIKQYDLDSIDEPLFKSILANQGKTDSEISLIMDEIVKYKLYDTNQIDPIRKHIRNIGNQSITSLAALKFPDDPEKYNEYIRTHEYKKDLSNIINTVDFDQLNISSIAVESNKGFASHYNFINESYAPVNKYELGQQVLVTARPGCFVGDTLISTNYGEVPIEVICDDMDNMSYYTYSTGGITKIVNCWISRYVNHTTIVEVICDDCNYYKFECTDDHLILMRSGTYTEAASLNIGDMLSSPDSSITTVVSVISKSYEYPIPVYDIEVDDESHNFLLGGCKVFVHNCGKTLFAMGECLQLCLNGARCHYTALGDMKPVDFIQRMGAIYSGFSFADSKLQIINMYNGLSKMLGGGKLGLSILPAASITVDEYLEYVMNRIDKYDVFFIDYDSNFKASVSDNLYKEGGYLYDRLTTLSNMGKLVFILAQPKISAWGKETLEITDVGESSRKQQSVDMIISIGAVSGNPNHIGTMSICKNRRGEEGNIVPYIRLNNGRFIIIPDGVYGELKTIKDKRNYTEGDITMMMNEYNAEMARARQSMMGGL